MKYVQGLFPIKTRQLTYKVFLRFSSFLDASLNALIFTVAIFLKTSRSHHIPSGFLYIHMLLFIDTIQP